MDILNFKIDFIPIYEWIITKGLDILITVVLAILVYYFGKRILIKLTKSIVKNTKHDEWQNADIKKRQNTLVGLFSTVWKLIIIFSVIYAILRISLGEAISSTFAPLFASAGVIGIAIGIGAQSLIKDFLTGIFIISENQYRVGDVVEIDNASGTVEKIGARSTVIRDIDGNVHYLPNGMVDHVINKTMGYSKARFTINLHPTMDMERVAKIIDDTGKELAKEENWKDKIIEPPSFIAVGEINGNLVELIVVGKTQPSKQWSVIAEMKRRLLDTFEREKIKLAVLPTLTNTGTSPGSKNKKQL